MKPAPTRTDKRRWGLAPTVMAFVIATLAGGVTASPAWSQENDWNRGHQSQRHHYSRARDHQRNDYEFRSYDRPAYVYSPPPVYYAPPPGPPVIDFVFPLRFR